LGVLGKKVFNERMTCGPRCEGRLNDLNDGLERVGEAMGRFRVGVRGGGRNVEVGGEG